MDRKYVLNFPISTGTYLSFVDRIIDLTHKKESSIICIANVHMFIEAYKNAGFLGIIKDANLITPDGRPLIWALNILSGVKQARVAGMDLLPDLLKKLRERNVSVYFYGGTEIMLLNTRDYLKKHYPEISIGGLYSPPFSEMPYDDEEIIKSINSNTSSIVFVVLGCPKQEKWMAHMRDKIHAVMIGIGGALPVMLGMQRRAPLWMQNAGLEWLFRLSQEPKRLFRRYVSTNTLFLWILFKEIIKIKFLKPLRLRKL